MKSSTIPSRPSQPAVASSGESRFAVTDGDSRSSPQSEIRSESFNALTPTSAIDPGDTRPTVTSVGPPPPDLGGRTFLVPTDEDIVKEQLSRTTLTRFHDEGINSSTWDVDSDARQRRMAYIGTPCSNLAYIVQEELANQYFSQSPPLHFQFSSIRPTLPWKPTKEDSLVKWYSSISEEVAAVPEKEVRDDIVNSFFAKIHPGFPILDEADFRRHYEDPRNPPPLILLQSVLLAGAHVCRHPKVLQSRSFVKITLFRRAKALFDMHFENDRMYMLQSALLFVWHSDGPDDVCSNVYYWAGIASRIAFGLGLHRDLINPATQMPLHERRLYRRVWWTLVQVEILVSLHHGRPSTFDPDDCDQPPLTHDDFFDADGLLNHNLNVDFCIQNSNLCEIILSVIKLSSPGSVRRYRSSGYFLTADRAVLDAKLAEWYLQLPLSLVAPSRPLGDFWTLQLQLHYNLALLHLHRLPDTLGSSVWDIYALQKDSTSLCHAAIVSMIKIFDEIILIDSAERCWFTSLTCLTSVAIQTSHETRYACNTGAILLALQGQVRLDGLLPVMLAISEYWPTAEAFYNLFRDQTRILKEKLKASRANITMPTSREASMPAAYEDVGCENTQTAPIQDRQMADSASWAGLFGVIDADDLLGTELPDSHAWLSSATNVFLR